MRKNLSRCFSLALTVALIGLLQVGFGCKNRPPRFGEGARDDPDPVSDTIELVGLKSDCLFTFEPTSANKTTKNGDTIDSDDEVRILGVSVKYFYQCGVPANSEVTAPWGGQKTWVMRFPTNCMEAPSTAPPDHLNYDDLEKDLLAELSCSAPAQIIWPDDVFDYADVHAANWPDWCLTGADDTRPYEITPLSTAEWGKGKASDVLFSEWRYQILTRYEDRTFVDWDKYSNGNPEDPESWIPIYSSPCDGYACDLCADINQVEMTITIEYYR